MTFAGVLVGIVALIEVWFLSFNLLYHSRLVEWDLALDKHEVSLDEREQRNKEDFLALSDMDDAETLKASYVVTESDEMRYTSEERIKRNAKKQIAFTIASDITAHFDGWKSLGLELGKSMYEAKVLGEAGQYPENGNASGTIDFAYAKVYTGEASTALHAPKFAATQNQNLQVFDMQGKLLGTVSITQGSSLSAAIKNKFHSTGIYMVKQGSAMKKVVAK